MNRFVPRMIVAGGAIAAALLIAPTFSAASIPPPPRTTTLITSVDTTNYAPPNGRPNYSVGLITIDDSDLNNTLTNLEAGFVMKPVAGQRLHVGHYRVDSTGNPQFAQIVSDSHSADSEVEILDLAADAYSHITRLDLLYRIAADQPDSTFGEIRMGEPESADHVLSSHTIYWPRISVGIPEVLATEFLQNTGSAALPVGRPSITGAGGDYTLHGDNCPAELPVGGYCSIAVGYSPRGSGTRTGMLSWPIGENTDQVALRGQVLPGYSELTSTGANYIDGGNTEEFVAGKYLQIIPFYAGEPRPIGFRVVANPQYTNTAWDRRWDLEVEPPPGEKFRVGTFTVPSVDDGKHWFVDLFGDTGCGSVLSGTLTIKQAVYDADGYLAQTDLTFQGKACASSASGIGPITIHLAFRSTVTPLQYVNPPPTSAGVGSTVPITGVAVPGSTVGVWFKSRTQPTFVQRRSLKVNSAGRFATTYQAMDDTAYYVTMGNGYLPVQYLTKVKPVIHAPASASPGSVVTLTGTGVAGQQVGLTFTPVGGTPVSRATMADATGNWVYRYTAGKTLTITAASEPNLTPSDPVTVAVTG